MCDLIVTCNRVFKRVTRVPGSFIVLEFLVPKRNAYIFNEDQIKCDYYNYLLVPASFGNNIFCLFLFFVLNCWTCTKHKFC